MAFTRILGPGIHTASNINSHNIKSTGIITAVSFVGDGSGLTGVASTDNIVTGTAATFNTYPVDINAGMTVAGVSTMAAITATTGTFSGAVSGTTANFSGNVTVGGVLTYEDVKNVDSLGIITARSGVDVDDFLDVGSNIKLGNAGVITATTFKGDGDFVDIDVDGHTNLDNVSILGVTTTTVGASGGGSVIRINKDGTSELTAAYNTNAATLAINDTALGAQIVLRGQSPKILFDQTGGGSGSIYWDQTDLRFYSGTPVSGTEIIRFRFTGIKVGSGTTIETNGQATFTGIVTAKAFKLANGSDVGTGAGGTWSTYTAGIATSKSVGVNTSTLDDTDLTGIGNSFKGLYISNGMIVHDNVLNGNHYIGTSMNGLMAGPVTIDGNLEIDGNYVVV